MGKSYRWFVGVDWGGECHQVCVLDGQRNKIGERSIEHTGQGLAEFAGWLDEIVAGEPATMAAALEVPHGALVETLLAHGFAVFSINPKQLDRFRDRHTVGGAKDDRRDAVVLAASMVTDIGADREVRQRARLLFACASYRGQQTTLRESIGVFATSSGNYCFALFPPFCACVQQLTSRGYGICWRKRLSPRRRRGYGQRGSRKY